MASSGQIDISSSDSDSDFREIDNYVDESPSRGTTSSMNRRVLPSWGTAVHANIQGHNGLSSKAPSSKRRNINEASSSRPPKHLRISSLRRDTGGTNGSNNAGGSDTSYGVHSSNQPMKSVLPASMLPSTSRLPKDNVVENNGGSQNCGTYGKSLPSATWSNSSNGNNNSMKENFVQGSVFDPSLHEKRGNRILPPSLIPGKYSSTTPFTGSNDSLHHDNVGEEKHTDTDERYVLQAAVQDLHQPKVEANLPHGLLSVPLLRHQKIALAWMLSKESSGLCLGGILADDQGLGKTVSMIALIQMQKVTEAKSKARNSRSSRTEAFNLDDEDESGVVAFEDSDQIKESEDLTIIQQVINTIKGFRSKRPTTGTLVVCPASVLRQWARELDEKVPDKSRLSVLIYHGGNRTKRPAALAKYDVVLTTYAIVTNEVPKQPVVEEDDEEQKKGDGSGLISMGDKKRKKSSANKKLKKGKKENDSGGPLARVKWSRVILDESQTIKNHRTQVARACCSLRAKRRWCLSGTPIQNSVDELFSYFRFLRYDPYDKYKDFISSIKVVISRDSAKGYKKLQVVLRNIMLRRTKGILLDGEPIINLPPKLTDLMKVDFTLEERAFYKKLEADSRKQFKAYAAAGTLNQNYANILVMLLRLRQACDHPLLVKGGLRSSNAAAGKVSTEIMAKNLPRELLLNLSKQLETSSAICLVCRDPPENAVVTMCGHAYCYQCVSDYLTGEDNTCPTSGCKEQLGADVVYSRPTLQKCIMSDDTTTDGEDSSVSCEVGEKSSMVLQSDYISSKVTAALDIITSHCISKLGISESSDKFRYEGEASSSSRIHILDSESREAEKAIVFSQWTGMLDLVEISLKNFCINYRRLDGTMSIAARDKAVKEFNADPEVDVMLMSLKAGNLGLNMVAACRVILLDLWWNPTTEDQAVDRAHRIGQTRPVTVTRLTIKDTVEDRILALQEEKRKMVASAFGEDQSGGRAARLTAEDLRFLFEGR